MSETISGQVNSRTGKTARHRGLSDISQDFRLADILGIPQAIKGFDKPDFCEVFSIYLLQGGNYD